MLKKLFYASASILMLAIAYHLGANSAAAQQGSTLSGFTAINPYLFVMTPNGDVYDRQISGENMYPTLHYTGNFWSGPTPAAGQTWGQLKSQYHK